MQNPIAIIPARRNSKSIPFKNRQVIDNLTIVDHAINFSKNFNFKDIILSTDDEFYIDDPKYKEYIYKRPAHLATDQAIISDVMVEMVEDKGLHDEFILLFEPTCLPRYRKQLNCIFDGSFENSGSRSLASFVKSPIIKEKIWIEVAGKITPDKNVWKRRQDYAKQYMLTGHYYGLWGKDIKKYYPGLCDENVFPILINEPFIDINTYDDLEEAKNILNNIT